jgi:hypothetical protein
MSLVRRVESKADLARFIHLPHDIYRGDRNWVPPLRADVAKTLTPGRNPYWEHARRELFLAERDGRAVGRIASIVDDGYNRHHASAVGFWGFFESVNDPGVAGALFDAAASFARERGMRELYGPANPSINDEAGLLIGPFDSPPMLKMAYNPAYYVDLVEAAGSQKVKDLYAYIVDLDRQLPEKMQRVMLKLKQKPGIEVRPIDEAHLDRDLGFIKEVYNDAWSSNWDFAPMTDAEIADLAGSLKPLLVPDFCPIVFLRGDPAGMCLMFPDYNEVLRRMGGAMLPLGWLKFLLGRGSIRQSRLWALGLKRRYHNLGLDSLMYFEAFGALKRRGYVRSEVSWILEDNIHIIRPIEMWGGRIYKTYRVYRRPVG